MQKKRQHRLSRKWTGILQNRKVMSAGKGYLFLLPSLLGMTGFVFIPFLDVFRRSFLQASGSGFVGLDNYRAVIGNKAFELAAKNTAKFMVICLPLLLILSLGIAVMVKNQISGGRQRRGPKASHMRWMKTGFLLPMAIPVSSVVVFFQMLFDDKGWLNLLTGMPGFDGKDWINSESAFCILVVCYIWKNLGYTMILWMSGLYQIEEEQYEAAKMEGADDFACFCYITLPQLKKTAFVTALLSFVNAFRVFREAYLLAGDYPHESIYMLQHLFNNWFVSLDIQKLTAAAVILIFVTGIVLIPCVRQKKEVSW